MRKTTSFLLGALVISTATPVFAGDIKALEKAIKEWSEESATPSYRHSFADLNDDGVDDAVVLITDNQYCGSGGCSFLIFRGGAAGSSLFPQALSLENPFFC